MKDLRLVVVAIAASLVVMLATGCTEQTSTSPQNVTSAVTVPEFEASATMLLPVEVSDATIENEVRVRPNPNDDRGTDNNQPGKRWGVQRGPFDRLLKALNLTDDQKAAVGDILHKHHDCVDAAMQTLREHVKTIVDSANAARRDVLAKLRAGEITRDEARAAMKSITERVRTALRNGNIVQRIHEMLKACDDEFVSNLKGILTPEQLDILQRWLDHQGPGHPPGPGSDSTRG